MTSPNQGLTPSAQLSGKLVSDDLDSSLANLVGSKCYVFVAANNIRTLLPRGSWLIRLKLKYTIYVNSIILVLHFYSIKFKEDFCQYPY